jgi:Amt family ammonium transporter
VNAQYEGFEWNYIYIVFCGFIVWLIIPGIGLLYSGLARRKSALTLLFQSLMIVAVYGNSLVQNILVGTNECINARTTFQWIFWGYSLAYSRDAGPFIGTLTNFGLKGVMAAPSPGSAVLPEIVFVLYQLLFCACTVSSIFEGAVRYADVHR